MVVITADADELQIRDCRHGRAYVS